MGRWTRVGSSVERLLNFPSRSHCVWAEADSKTPELGAQDAGNSCPLRMTNGFTLSVNKFDGVGGGQGRAPSCEFGGVGRCVACTSEPLIRRV